MHFHLTPLIMPAVHQVEIFHLSLCASCWQHVCLAGGDGGELDICRVVGRRCRSTNAAEQEVAQASPKSSSGSIKAEKTNANE